MILPHNTKVVQQGVFFGCQSLSTLVIPDSVVEIAFFDFVDYYQLTLQIYCEAESQPETWLGVWESKNNIKIHWGVEKN